MFKHFVRPHLFAPVVHSFTSSNNKNAKHFLSKFLWLKCIFLISIAWSMGDFKISILFTLYELQYTQSRLNLTLKVKLHNISAVTYNILPNCQETIASMQAGEVVGNSKWIQTRINTGNKLGLDWKLVFGFAGDTKTNARPTNTLFPVKMCKKATGTTTTISTIKVYTCSLATLYVTLVCIYRRNIGSN